MTQQPLRAKAALGRADLLRAQVAGGDAALAFVAGVMGYVELPPEVTPPQSRARQPAQVRETQQPDEPPPQARIERPRVLPQAYFYCVTERTQLPPEQRRAQTQPPDWLQEARVLTQDERPDPAQMRLPQRLPLANWARLWPFLRAVLGYELQSRDIDLGEAISRINRGEALRRIPLRVRRDWNPRICIVVDYHRAAQPYWDDFNALMMALEKLHGKLGLEVRILVGEMGREPRYRHPSEDSARHWRMPSAGTALLVLSDLGGLADSDGDRRAWAEFGARLALAECRAVVLSPLSPQNYDARLRRLYSLHYWDRSARFRREAQESASSDTRSAAAELLLTLLAPAIVVESNLLRAMRYLLSPAQAGAEAEAHVWQHTDVVSSPQGFRFASPAVAQKYQHAFRTLDPQRRKQAVALIRAHHAALPASVRMDELAACQRLAPEQVEAQDQQAVEAWRQDMARTCLERSASGGLARWRGRHVARQIEYADPATKALWALEQKEKLARGEAIDLPEGITFDEVAYFLRDPKAQRLQCVLSQHGQELTLEPSLATADTGGPHFPLAHLTLRDARLQLARAADDAGPQVLRVLDLPKRLLTLPHRQARIVLRTSDESLVVSSLSKPQWAQAIGRDRDALYAVVEWLGKRCRLSWQPPEAVLYERPLESPALLQPLGESGHWVCDQPLGVDPYGLFADLHIESITQRFRWILPGTFLMGSPASEPERGDNEAQHEVTLTRGFWLADTACTQALWQAVMGENPSNFKDDLRNPVENVSWEDAQRFIAALNRRVTGLNACLPTEAQWEYACRAGTRTPFSFGDSISSDQVNYNGEYPYNNQISSELRGHTVPVASLPPNPWGLYEMHGNVFEWCEDWYGDYAKEHQTDPRGARAGANRVLRGGSWIYYGRLARSAYRRRLVPGARLVHFGFRLALGHGPSGQEAPAGEPRGTRGGKAGAQRESRAAPETLLQRAKKILRRK